jgi:membrane-associated phospholipid phosphatase
VGRLLTVSRALDLAAPFFAVVLTAFVVLERTPRQEPILYGGVLGVLVTLSWASARSRSAYGLWALYVGSFAAFGIARSFADETGMQTHVEALVAADKTLTGTVPTVWLQERLFDPWNISWLDQGATYMHWSYFVLPHIFAAHIFLSHRHLFERYVLLFVGVLAVGLAMYFAFPAAPPWVASIQGQIDPTYKIATQVGNEFHVNLYTRFESQIRSSNPVAAMPSLHMAVSVVVLLIAMRINWTLGAVALLYNAAMAFSLIYLGEHYLIDILMGIAVSVMMYAVVETLLRQRERGLARALAELEGAGEDGRRPRRAPGEHEAPA